MAVGKGRRGNLATSVLGKMWGAAFSFAGGGLV